MMFVWLVNRRFLQCVEYLPTCFVIKMCFIQFFVKLFLMAWIFGKSPIRRFVACTLVP